MSTESLAQTLTGLVVLMVPLCYALAAFWPAQKGVDGLDGAWRRAERGSLAALVLGLLLVPIYALTGESVARLLQLVPLGGYGALALSLRLDVLTVVMVLLVSFIGLIIVHYSRRYLDGDPGQLRYIRWLMATLAAVALLVTSDNLLLLALAWIGTSLALHQLLTFFPDRPAALIAAHKKFIASRVADLCLIGAIALVGASTGSLELDAVFATVATHESLPGTLALAAVLFVASAVLKCALLPFHGWLIQVMEAPTPVSALLHAGVVNIGGFLMIRLAPLMAEAHFAQTLLVLAGGVTAAVAALVMTTRVSIKVMLAWSTCAQMGFMLMQCGLGAYPLALLHIVAHSLYKAHAFLSSGSVVQQWRADHLLQKAPPASLAVWIAALLLAPLGVLAMGSLYGVSPADAPALWVLCAVLSLALTPLIVRGTVGGPQRFLTLIAGSLGVAALYFTWHALFEHLLSVPAMAAPGPLRVTLALALFVALFALYATMAARPDGALARRLYPALFAGLYLDELFTRLTFRIWPAGLPRPAVVAQPRILAEEIAP